MLIGVCGKIGAGKDVIGKYLISHHSFHRFAFADPIKELAMHLGWDGRKNGKGRRFLQELGQRAREIAGEDIWVQALNRRMVDHNHDIKTGRTVITDVRYPNEAGWIQSLGGIILRVERPSLTDGVADLHVSEQGACTIAPDHVILNDSSISVLHKRINDLIGWRL